MLIFGSKIDEVAIHRLVYIYYHAYSLFYVAQFLKRTPSPVVELSCFYMMKHSFDTFDKFAIYISNL